MRVIYDLGAHEGQDIAYYLKSADVVIAVEANPSLCEIMQTKFVNEVLTKKLIIVNKCIVPIRDKDNEKVPFYKNRFDSGASRFLKPKVNPKEFEIIYIESTTVEELFKFELEPLYIKIDLEGLDRFILKEIHENKIKPKFLSFENCGKDVLENIIENEFYSHFNIVSFYNYSSIYKKTKTKTAGYFGKDIKSPWLNGESVLKLYDKMPNSWFDIHCTNEAFETGNINLAYYEEKVDFLLEIKKLLPFDLKLFVKKIIGYTR